MAKLKVKIVSNNYIGANVKVDGELLRFRKSKDKNDSSLTQVAEVEVAKKNVPIEISNWYELERKNWFFYYFFFWLIGVFGLVSPSYDKKCYKIKYETNLEMLEGKDDSLIEIKFINPFKEGYAMELSSNFTTTLNSAESNKYFRSYVAEKRRKIVSVLGFFATIAAAAIIASILLNA